MSNCNECFCELIVPDTWLKSSRDSNQYKCRDCKNKYLRKWRAKNPGAYKEWKYNLTQIEYEELLQKQGGLCAICGTDSPKGRRDSWHIDHNHDTGKVRGLLCWLCNSGLGKFRDNFELLTKAANYIKEND